MWKILGPIILGALIAVPLMLLFVFSAQQQMESGSAPPPIGETVEMKQPAPASDAAEVSTPADDTAAREAANGGERDLAAREEEAFAREQPAGADAPTDRTLPPPSPPAPAGRETATPDYAAPDASAPDRPKIAVPQPDATASGAGDTPESGAAEKPEEPGTAIADVPKSLNETTRGAETGAKSGGQIVRRYSQPSRSRGLTPSSPGPAPGPSAPMSSDLPESVTSLDTAEPSEIEEEAAPAVGEVKEDWTVVPVFYGTDRQKTTTVHRVTYDWQRGRRLELGRALVTVPKDHEVPMVERPWALKIPYLDITLYQEKEDPKRHFTIEEIKSLSREEFLALVRDRLASSQRFEDHALVFVHGYQTKFDNAVFRTAQIAYDLKFDGAPFLYSWPSGGTLQGYTYDRESAAQSEPFLREFLTLVRDETGAKKVSIIAHSMGNQPLLRVLQDLKRSMPEGVLISQLILAAPDVDRHNFENIVGAIKGIAEGITLYAAANDTALSISRRVNGGVPRAGDVPVTGPVIIEGVDTIDATATSMDSVGINHSGYAENNALLEDIGKLIDTGMRPPEVRLPTLEKVENERGIYWRYPAQ